MSADVFATEVGRRAFLSYGGAAAAGITLGELGRRWLGGLERAPGLASSRDVESWAVSVCRECPAACGVRVRLVNAAPVKLEGNPLCPIGRGRLCAKGQAALEAYFDPDRLVGPARRIGNRDDQRWEPITWEAALALVATRVEAAKARGQQVLALAAEEQGPIADAWAEFWSAVGGRAAWTSASTAARLRPAFEAMTGLGAEPLFDVERSTYVLSFGAPLVEEWLSPVWAQRSYGRFRRGAATSRGRLVQVEGRRSMTARKADEWLALPAEHHVTLAYGIASALLRESRARIGATQRTSDNLSEFQAAVIARYTPDDVAAAIGVPVVNVLRLARELVSTERPLVIAPADAHRALIDAVFALNALIGAFDRAGGVFAAPIEPPAPRAEFTTAPGDIAKSGPAAGVLVLRDASLLRSPAVGPSTAAALTRADFVVSLSPYLDESAAVADVLLPVHTPLESWHAVVPATAIPAEAVAVAGNAVAPRLGTQDVLWVLRSLADRLKLPAAEGLPTSSEAVAMGALARLSAMRRGSPYTNDYATEWTRQLEKGGWWVPSYRSSEEFVRAAVSAGGWMDPYFEAGQIQEALAHGAGLTLPVTPTLRPTRVSAEPSGFPLRLTMFVPAALSLAGSPNQPVLFELLGQPEGPPWSAWLELAPETARAFSVQDGARVLVESAAGSVQAVAMVVGGMPPNILAMAFLPAVPRGGRWARLVDDDARRLWESGPSGAVPVRLRKV